jgi:beta-1,4-mannosyl-glycoprotein beta-1,4-N-acetylglucosaminyltransferase
MKIYDCTTFYAEDLMYELRLNILNESVHKFIVKEDTHSHSGKPKKLNFNINNYSKFKDKIIYIVIDKEPVDIQEVNDKDLNFQSIKRANSLKRIELSYNKMFDALDEANDNDLIILSDNDEIPNLKSNLFKKTNKDIILFNQLLFYYKFNLNYDILPWFGSKACKKKKLLSMSWLNNLKTKKYPFWRLDVFFSNKKYTNIEIINNGGWHFTNLMSPKDIYNKFMNFGHHDEFELSGLTIQDIKKKVDSGEVFYNHFADKNVKNKWDYNYKLKKVSDDLLPDYLIKNKSKYKIWFN